MTADDPGSARIPHVFHHMTADDHGHGYPPLPMTQRMGPYAEHPHVAHDLRALSR